jgi:hypothetical protein
MIIISAKILPEYLNFKLESGTKGISRDLSLIAVDLLGLLDLF